MAAPRLSAKQKDTMRRGIAQARASLHSRDPQPARTPLRVVPSVPEERFRADIHG